MREAETRRQVDRLKHDLDVARSIQQSLLPTNSPEIQGFEIAAWNQPADQTGGDYYDWQLLPSGKLVVALADVHGSRDRARTARLGVPRLRKIQFHDGRRPTGIDDPH